MGDMRGGRGYKGAAVNLRDDEYIILIVVMALQLHTYDKTYQIVHVLYVQFIISQLFLKNY